MTNGMNKPEIETLSYHSSLCKCPECERGHKPAQEAKEKTTPIFELKTKAESKVVVSQRLCEKCQVPNCGCKAVILKEPEQPKCKTCGGTKRIYAEHIGEPYGKECPDCLPK